MTTSASVVRGQVLVAVNLGSATALAEMSPRGRAAFLVEAFASAERTAAEFIDGSNVPERPLSSLSASPSCTGCGTSVERVGERCAACRMKDEARAPQPRMALVNEGTPPYTHTGNFRDAQRPSEETPT